MTDGPGLPPGDVDVTAVPELVDDADIAADGAPGDDVADGAPGEDSQPGNVASQDSPEDNAGGSE